MQCQWCALVKWCDCNMSLHIHRQWENYSMSALWLMVIVSDIYPVLKCFVCVCVRERKCYLILWYYIYVYVCVKFKYMQSICVCIHFRIDGTCGGACPLELNRHGKSLHWVSPQELLVSRLISLKSMFYMPLSLSTGFLKLISFPLFFLNSQIFQF